MGSDYEAEVVSLEEIAHHLAAEDVAHSAVIRGPARHTLNQMSTKVSLLSRAHTAYTIMRL